MRTMEKDPLSYVINHLSFRIGEKITMERVKVKPLLMVPQDDLRIRANGTDQRIEATVAEALCGTASRHSGGRSSAQGRASGL